MEVLETREQAAEREKAENDEKEVVREVSRVLREAQEDIEREHSDDSDEKRDGFDAKMDADVSKHVESSPVLGAMSDRIDPVGALKTDSKSDRRVVTITDGEKSAFIDSVVSGKRYVSEEKVFGGRISVKFRSRSALESEAIDAFIRKRVSLGIISNDQSYSDTMRFCVLAAGVEELNGEKFKTLSEAGGGASSGMFYTESDTGLDEPKWVWLYDLWRNKPESLVAIVIESYFDFETKYWTMISKAKNENFWSPGGSTGE